MACLRHRINGCEAWRIRIAGGGIADTASGQVREVHRQAPREARAASCAVRREDRCAATGSGDGSRDIPPPCPPGPQEDADAPAYVTRGLCGLA